MRGVIEGAPAAACRLLGIPVTNEPQILPTEFRAWTKRVDLLLRVAPGRLAHVEYARRGDRKLVQRMLEYRCLIMRDYPDDELTQHVIVLGEGRVEGHDDPAGRGFWLDLGIVYLRERDPGWFLVDPDLAPLAALGRGGPEDRARSCRDAIRRIHQDGGARTEDLLDFTGILATIVLERRSVDGIIEEVGMTAESIAEFYRDTVLGHVLQDVGREQGLEQGIEQGREAVLIEMITDRFGSNPAIPAIAHRLAGWPSGAVHTVTAATSLNELAQAEAPS